MCWWTCTCTLFWKEILDIIIMSSDGLILLTPRCLFLPQSLVAHAASRAAVDVGQLLVGRGTCTFNMSQHGSDGNVAFAFCCELLLFKLRPFAYHVLVMCLSPWLAYGVCWNCEVYFTRTLQWFLPCQNVIYVRALCEEQSNPRNSW